MNRIEAINNVLNLASQVHGEFCIPSDNCPCHDDILRVLAALGVTREEMETALPDIEDFLR